MPHSYEQFAFFRLARHNEGIIFSQSRFRKVEAQTCLAGLRIRAMAGKTKIRKDWQYLAIKRG
jgi:hypothetical protein